MRYLTEVRNLQNFLRASVVHKFGDTRICQWNDISSVLTEQRCASLNMPELIWNRKLNLGGPVIIPEREHMYLLCNLLFFFFKPGIQREWQKNWVLSCLISSHTLLLETYFQLFCFVLLLSSLLRSILSCQWFLTLSIFSECFISINSVWYFLTWLPFSSLRWPSQALQFLSILARIYLFISCLL